MCDKQIVEKWHKIVGFGIFRGPVSFNKLTKPLYIAEISRWDDVLRFFDLFKLYLGDRRQKKIEEAISTCKPKWTKRQFCNLPKDCGYCGSRQNTVKGYIYHRKKKSLICQGCYKAYCHYYRQRRSKKVKE